MRIIPSVRSLLFALVVLTLTAASFGQIGVSITIAPPALPVYEQPPPPAEGYIWTPGYWAYGDDDYFWVPGTWVLAPEPGFLWTPPYWGWGDGVFLFHEGYWGPRVGFYGGIFYGFGYFGEGFEGGRWENERYFYNRAVTNVNVTEIHNVYNTTVINNRTVNRVSYNGGNGGTTARPTAEEEAAAQERRVPPVAAQTQHVQAARSNPQLRASANQGKPPIAATPRPGAFSERGVVPAKEAGAPYHAEPNRGAEQARSNTSAPHPENTVPRPPTHAKDLQAHPRPPAPNTGDANRDQKYQQQQDKLYAKQNQDHQNLQQKQEQDHQRLEQQKADDARKQQVEQQHQQQIDKMEQKHTEQSQHLQTKQQPANQGAPKERP